jgi:hypothetical protein
MLRADTLKYSGACMAGFIRWIDARWSEWDAAHGYKWLQHTRSPQEHDAFTKWLLEVVTA